MTKGYNRILFDYDGTLIIHDKYKEGEVIAKLLNIPDEKVPEFNKRLIHLFETSYGSKYFSNKKMTKGLYYYIFNMLMGLEDFNITPEQLDQAINYKATYMTPLAPNAQEILEYLKDKGYELCLFTNGFYNAQLENMKAHGISEYFEKIYAWDDFYAKPDLRAIRRAIAGTEVRRNVMIGDSIVSDIAPAKKCGVHTIGYNIRDLSKIKIFPSVIITDLLQLKEIL